MRVLIMGSYPLFREAIASQLVKVTKQVSIFEAVTPEQAVALLDVPAHFDLAICCLDKHEQDYQWLQQLRKNSLELKILIILEDNQLFKQLKQQFKIDGFLAKSADIHEVENALKLVLMGECYLSPSLLVTYRLLNSDTLRPHAQSSREGHLLTPRQLQVLKLIAAGCSNKDIANQLMCTDGTIKLHVSAILREFKVSNRISAIKYAAKAGIISVV